MMRVFIADDEEIIRDGIRNCIEKEQERFLFAGEAPDGEMALPMLMEMKPDVLITDIRMPFMDGLELAKVVRRTMPWLRIVFLSGHDEFEYAQKAVSLHADAYLLKPVSSAQLLETLGQEQHVANYLQIQSVRYGSIMRYTIDIDPALHERYMLKIVLQPLVENAIYHGIKRRRGRGQITVTGRRQAGGMYFAVEDNGMGMTPERLAEVRASLQNGAPLDPDGKGGYGLRNVEQRLRLYYGCGLTIESEYRHGTRISFTVPDEQEGKTL